MRKAALTVSILLACAAPVLIAQRDNTPDPAKFVARQVQHLTTLLDLNATQIQVATKAFTDAAAANSQSAMDLRTAHKTLQSDIESGSPNIANDAVAIGALEGKILANNAAAEQAFWASLSLEQQMKYKQLGHGGFGHGPGPGPGGPGGPFGGRP